jgi:predicted negative regulator of RcsB-dependent stress response
VARITRKELKADKFALEVEHTVTFFEEHQKQLIRYGAIAVGVILLIVAYTLYSRHEHSLREDALARAIQMQEAPVGPPTPGQNLNFPTQDAKDQVALKTFSDLAARYPSSDEGEIAEYYVGCIQADQGRLAEAEKSYQSVVDHGSKDYASLSKLALAQIYFADGRADKGESLLRDVIAHPTVYVSKEQATLTLARYLKTKKPAEAKKLLDPLRSQQGPVGQVALQLYGELPPG